MKCKYIIVEQGNLKVPFVFSELSQHAEVARGVGGKVIGAGFCFIDEDKFHCYGESISCNVKSNGEADAKILNRIMGIQE